MTVTYHATYRHTAPHTTVAYTHMVAYTHNGHIHTQWLHTHTMVTYTHNGHIHTQWSHTHTMVAYTHNGIHIHTLQEAKYISSFFSYFYMAINIGSLVASTALVYVCVYVCAFAVSMYVCISSSRDPNPVYKSIHKTHTNKHIHPHPPTPPHLDSRKHIMGNWFCYSLYCHVCCCGCVFRCQPTLLVCGCGGCVYIYICCTHSGGSGGGCMLFVCAYVHAVCISL